MYPEFWQRMLRYTNQMEDMCSFAQISRYFYRVTNIDFQKLCYKNIICRFEGETWATAFSKARYRTIRSGTNHISQNSISCPHTGFMALVLQQKQVLLTHIDFGNKVFELLDFSEYAGQLVNVQLINKSTQLLLDMQITNGTLVDLLNQKEYEVETIKLPEDVHIRTADVFGYRKYVGFVNPRREFVVIHNETGKMDIIFQSQFSGHDIWLFDDIEHVGRTISAGSSQFLLEVKKASPSYVDDLKMLSNLIDQLRLVKSQSIL
ncbi:unnamed protein product [Bursaphelenchus okinawaensis]|uniref:Uncharacterized protein n=1 Tax=Bursaphelenchus okinawaensis TaxID=465554 RepID=A0A811L812_9BILA|nr:unnamed protein product [Bursaphelenchus okinawaensis]CAG9119777.1 unnamed protein product [Bursaphelenchus okinawaensis]